VWWCSLFFVFLQSNSLNTIEMKKILSLSLFFCCISGLASHATIPSVLHAEEENASADTLTIAMVGDVMMGTTYPSMMLPADEGKQLFKDASQILLRADLTVGNLEGALCDGGHSTKGTGPNSYSFRMPTSFAPRLKEVGFDFMSMANNHANDFGQEGIESTERCLKQQGILFSGIEGRVESAVIERAGKKIGLCAFGHNSYTLKHTDLKVVGRIVDDLVSRCDLVVVSFHGGAEGRSKNHLPQGGETFLGENRGSLRQLAHFCIDHGADVVYGHGPHVLRAAEVYKGRFIAYSLGNFCTPYNVSLTGISGYAPLLEIKIDAQTGKFICGQIHPFIQTRGIGPRTDKTGAVIREMKQLTEADVPQSQATISADGAIMLKSGH
jgi:poly-gamma-glutamate capsule biosynthesis protein CapA/YwtB (metallophosphatase superfamily)